MSDRVKLFIYTDAKTHRVLLTKKSTKFNFLVGVHGVHVHILSSRLPLPEIKPFTQTYEPKKGFKKAVAKISRQEQDRLGMLRRKVEIIILVLTSLYIMRDEIKASFAKSVLENTPISSDHFKKYWLFVAEEKKLLFARLHKFRKKFSAAVNAADSMAEVDALYEHMRFNVNLGVYSVMNRERKGLDGTKS
jgi:hypothetical protein